MHANLKNKQFDLVTPDGKIVTIDRIEPTLCRVEVEIENIDDSFVGFELDCQLSFFNIKSLLAQLGMHSLTREIEYTFQTRSARVQLDLIAKDPIATKLLAHLDVGCYIGKIFAKDDRRRVRSPDYLSRMFGRSDRRGRPLLSLGGPPGDDHLILEKQDHRVIAKLPTIQGVCHYDQNIEYLLPTLAKGLKDPHYKLRNLLRLHQEFDENRQRAVKPGEILLLRTQPLHIRTVFALVVDELLPEGVSHTSASILQPDTHESGDIYELFGESAQEVREIPLEFYTLSPYQEHVFFSDRDQLQACLEKPHCLFDAMETAPPSTHHKAAVFVVKGTQLLDLKGGDWVSAESPRFELPEDLYSTRRNLLLQRYMEGQPSYPFLKAIQDGIITSEGILLSRYFPSPRMKRMFLSEHVQKSLKGIYFQIPSRENGEFFTHEDRAFLVDLARLSIPIYWIDKKSDMLLQFVLKPGKDSGMFVPQEHVQTFLDATMLGVYGSNLMEGIFIDELTALLKGLLEMRPSCTHPLLNPETPLALVTGGGPGAMAVGNQVATELGILSCANIIDFSKGDEATINEQNQNPYIQGKMTYSLDRLVERQAEFNLDLPIFLEGGIGTDFEFALEEVRRKVGVNQAYPVLLFGTPDYWRRKITSRFHCNIESGTIVGSEWVSNCFYVVQNAQEGLHVYRQFFAGQLQIGPHGPIAKEGFISF